MNRCWVGLGLPLLLASCVATNRSHDDLRNSPRWDAPPLPRAVSVRDGRTGREIPYDAWLAELAQADTVFLGEYHTDETTHRVELAVYDALLARRSGRVVLALEMFERDVQPTLDAYLSGKIDEPEFLAHARPWGNYQTAYRPLIERAKAKHGAVVASNFPAPLRQRIAREGAAVLESLTGDARGQAPAQLLPNTAAYWRRADNAIRSHRGMVGGQSEEDRLYSTQSLWDNAMGESCALALAAHPGYAVLHVNGAFHSAYWDGTVRQLRLRRPETKVLTVAIAPVTDPAVADVSGAPLADYVVFVAARATDVDEGHWSTAVTRQAKYRFHVPASATDKTRVPLLIFLADDGLTANDGLDLWRERLGGEVAIAVLEPLYSEIEPDASEGGRWFGPEHFSEDLDATLTAVEGTWGYLLRHYPIDPQRVCLAGEGAGATMVAATALLSERMNMKALAFNPRQYAKLKDIPLPLPENYGNEPRPDKQLRVAAAVREQAWWTDECREYTAVGFDAAFEPLGDDPWQSDAAQENALRAALGLATQPKMAAADHRYMLADAESPRARHWARLQALRRSAAENAPIAVLDAPPTDPAATLISTEIHAESFTAADALPRCPGPFGGTTVVVVPDDAPAQDVRAWVELQKDDPLSKTGRFHRLRVACNADGQRLPDVLQRLVAENRKNVLIVPAVFCADVTFMRLLQRSARPFADSMTIQWLPGLGGRKLARQTEGAAGERATPVSHKLAIVLQPESHRLTVDDTIELPRALSRQGSVFTLNAALEIRACEPPVRPEPAQDAGAKRYVLESAPSDGVLHLKYEGPLDFGLSEQKEEYTRGFRESRGMLGTQGVYLHGATAWVPQFDDGLIRFEMTVQQPDGWHVISAGAGTSRGADGRAHWDSTSPVEDVPLVGGPLQLEHDSAGAVEILTYLHESDEALARKYLDATARYIEMYRKLIGPYPYPKFALVENFWETGYGLPSFTLLGPQIIRFPFILTSSYPHEVLHNWWGNSVFVDDSAGNWSEGLTAYLADHLMQEQQGQGAPYRRGVLQKYRDYVKAGRDFPLTEFHERHSAATEAVGYGKSLMLFHMLRRQLGEDGFRAGLTTLYREQRGQRAKLGDVQAAFEHATEKDLGAFFKQWANRKGAPALALADVQVAAAAGKFKIVGSLNQIQAEEPFTLDVPVYVRTEAGQEAFIISTRERRQPFEFPVASRPLLVAADPLFDVFRVLDPLETPPSIGQIFGEPEILAVLPASAANEAAPNPYRELVQAWQSDDHHIKVVLDSGIADLPDDRAVWILGQDNHFAATILADQEHVKLVEQGAALQLGSEQAPLRDHSFVVVERNRRNPEQAVGWLVLDPPKAAAGLARKLPHYGKYSYLAFAGDEPSNVIKGQWDTANSPLTVNCDQPGTSAAPIADDRKALAELPPVFSRQALQAQVNWFAAPERNGRGLGTPELLQCAQYIRQRLEAAGLQPGGDNGTFFQHFMVEKGPEGQPVEGLNVIGILPGTKAAWADQSVILSAHYDHLGRGWPDVHQGDAGVIHPGADDNASGIAVLLELARDLAAAGKPSRNLVVIAFSGEEAGRAGSRYYVEHPRFPRADIRGVINLDTVGRLFNGKIQILGAGTAEEWQHIFRGCGFVTGIQNQIVPGSAEASDQASFIDQRIPGVQIFTGAHADYHRPTDTPDKIDSAGLVQVATFVKEALAYVLEREPPLTVKIEGAAAPAAAPPAASEASGRKVLFGVVPDFDYRETGVRVASLVADSPAAQAGLREGDILIRLGNQEVKDLMGFSQFLKKLTPGQELEATYLRSGTPSTVKVTVKER